MDITYPESIAPEAVLTNVSLHGGDQMGQIMPCYAKWMASRGRQQN